MGITDHGQYKPSIEAIEFFNDLSSEFCLCPGEEIHPPDNPIHIVSFGSKAEVSVLFGEDKYHNEVLDILSTLVTESDCDIYQFSSALWVFREIKKLGGMSIFCHPYWRHRFEDALQENYISESLITEILKQREFDAYEALSGYESAEQNSNILQVARYCEERLNFPLPIIGVSDAHSCYDGFLGTYFTVVLAESCNFDDVKKAICSNLSVAVEKLPEGKFRVHGQLRLVRYVLFLLREYFPMHDAFCEKEGELLMEWAGRNADQIEKHSKIAGKIPEWRRLCLGR